MRGAMAAGPRGDRDRVSRSGALGAHRIALSRGGHLACLGQETLPRLTMDGALSTIAHQVNLARDCYP